MMRNMRLKIIGPESFGTLIGTLDSFELFVKLTMLGGIGCHRRDKAQFKPTRHA